MRLPKHRRNYAEVRDEMIARGAGDANWRDGRTAMYVFNAGEEILGIQKDAYALYMSENGLGPQAFPSLAQMEREVCSMGLGLLNAPDGAVGTMTSGGSESILLAVKTARDFARENGKPRDGANIVLPVSAHLAFDKAAHLMDLEVRRVALKADNSFEADPAAMNAAIDDATILLTGSAPCFPFGIVDPIAALGEIATARHTWLHVDACVGGYFAPFARLNGIDVAPFDFAVPGVSSMSADLHKFGYAAKGASTVFFRNAALAKHLAFNSDAWSGAPMRTPTMAGTRPGGAISAAWAVMNTLGQDGYCDLQARVTRARESIETGVRALGFEVLGAPCLSIVAFRHPAHDTMALFSGLRARGWFTSVNINPASLHLMLSPKHEEVAADYLADLAAVMQTENNAPKTEARYS